MQTIKKNLFLIATITPAFVYIVSFFVIIAFYLLNMSLTTYVGGMPTGRSFQNYITLIQSADYKSAFLRTVWFVSIVTPIQLITGIITAMLINKTFPCRGLVRSIFLLPLAIPTVVTTSILLIIFSRSGHIPSLLMGEYSFFPRVMNTDVSFLSNEFLALSIAAFGKIWRDTPISMLIILAGLQSIPEDQYEAATTMGSGAVKNFFYITLPLLVPAISSVLVLRSIENWKEFIFPYILAPAFPVLGVLVQKYFVELINPGMASAIAIMLIAVIVLSTVILKRIVTFVNDALVKI